MSDPNPAPPIDPFYDPPLVPDGMGPGCVLRQMELPGPADARVWRILYTSTGLQGEPVVVSGLAAVPTGAPPRGGFPVVTVGHTTTGVARICAPSIDPFQRNPTTGAAPLPFYAWMLEPFVRAGYAVAASDYRGRGVPGASPYLAGELEASDLLDAARALRQVDGVEASRNTIVWGHSVGGQAAAAAGERAKSYAPDLNVVGVVAEAPAVALHLWLASVPLLDQPSDAVGVLMMAIHGWSTVYEGVEVHKVLTSAAQGQLGLVKEVYLPQVVAAYMAQPARSYFLAEGFSADPWPGLINRNTPGNTDLGIPIMVVQGLADNIIFPDMTLDFVTRLCRAGNAVTFQTYSGIDHYGLVSTAMPDVLPWMAARFAAPEA